MRGPGGQGLERSAVNESTIEMVERRKPVHLRVEGNEVGRVDEKAHRNKKCQSVENR